MTFGLLFSPPQPSLDKLQSDFPQVRFLQSVDGDSSFLPDVDAILAWNLTLADVQTAARLRWVQWVGAGVEQAPLAELQRRGIVLTNNRGVHAPNISEHVLAMMLAFSRQLPTLLEAQSRKLWLHWSDHDQLGSMSELGGSTLLIVGAGQIGSTLAAKAKALGMRVIVVGRAARPGEDAVIGVDQLDSLLPEADHVAICVPLTPETHGLFDWNRLGKMKQGARLYNIGRGQIVDTDALTGALTSGHLGGAGLDVSDPEPLPPDHPLWDAPNLIITSHTSGMTPRYWERAYEILATNLRHFLAGEPLTNVVQLDRGY